VTRPPTASAVRRAAAAQGLQLARDRAGRYVLHAGDEARWVARGDLRFLAVVLDPPERGTRPRWARRP